MTLPEADAHLRNTFIRLHCFIQTVHLVGFPIAIARRRTYQSVKHTAILPDVRKGDLDDSLQKEH